MYWTRVKDRCLWRGSIPVVLFSYCFSSVAMNASGSNSAPGGISMAIEKIWVTIFSLQCLSYVFDDGYAPRNQWSVLMMEFHEFLFSSFDGKITVP